MSRRLLILLPLAILLFPQGTRERAWVWEPVVVLFLAAAGCAALAHRVLAARAGPVSRGRLHAPMLLLLAYFCIINPAFSLLRGNVPGAVLLVVLPFVMLAVYYVLLLADIRLSDLSYLADATALGSAAVGATIIWVWATGDLEATSNRAVLLEDSRTLMYPTLPMGAVVAFTHFVFTADRRRRLMHGAVFALCAVAIVLTVTRAMLLAFAIGCTIVAVSAVRNRRRFARGRHAVRYVVAGAVVGALALLPAASAWQARLDTASASDIGTIVSRVDEIRIFWAAFIASPVMGQGLGYMFFDPGSLDLRLREGVPVPHNALMFFLGATGALGLLLYAGVIGPAVRGLFRGARRVGPEHPIFAPMLGLAAGAVAGILFTLTSTTYTTLAYNVYLAIMVYVAGFAVPVPRRIPSPVAAPQRANGRPAAGAAPP